jgi:hypothetical protein
MSNDLQIRSEEIKLLSKTALIKTINLCVVFAVPPVLGLVIFGTYVFNVSRVRDAMLQHKKRLDGSLLQHS